MNFITVIISEELTYALGNTLLHSLWQGAAVVLILTTIRLGLRRFSSNSNYLISVTALVLIFCMSVFTFISSFQSKTTLKSELYQLSPEETFLSQPSQVTQEKKLDNKANHFQAGINSITNYFYLYLPLIVTIWLSGLLVQSFRFAGGFLYNQRLKINKTNKVAPAWESRFQALCQKTGISQTVRLLESAIIKIPIVIGHLKPIILLPIGMISQLPQNQVEAILIHELAHIKRKDYLLNLFQSIIDILFFYHPAVKWISAIVSEERENCCDDIAINISGDKLNFAKALVNIQSSQFNSHNYVIAAVGKRRQLFQRISRLFSHPHTNSGLTEKLISTVIIVLCFITVAAHSQSYFYKQDLKTNIAVMPLLPEIQMLQGSPNSIIDSAQTETILANQPTEIKENKTRFAKKLNIIKNKKPLEKINTNQDKEEIIQIKNQTKYQATLLFPAQKNRFVRVQLAEKTVKELYLDKVRIYDWELDNYWLLMDKFIKPHFDYMKSQKKFKKYYSIIENEYAKTKERFEKSLVHKKMLSKEFYMSEDKFRERYEDLKTSKKFERRHLEDEREKLVDELEHRGQIKRKTNKKEMYKEHREHEEEIRKHLEIEKTEDIKKDIDNDRKHEERRIILEEKLNKIEKQLQEQHHEINEKSEKELQRMKHGIHEMEKQIHEENSISKRRRLEIEEDIRQDRENLEKRIRGVKKKISDVNEKFIVNELLKDGLIQDEDGYSFEMTNKYLKVNKKKQPKKIYEKYKEIVKSRYGVKFHGKLKFIISTR
jgi:beta-lactamase regulating signal transducer with metallopeptidase domain